MRSIFGAKRRKLQGRPRSGRLAGVRIPYGVPKKDIPLCGMSFFDSAPLACIDFIQREGDNQSPLALTPCEPGEADCFPYMYNRIRSPDLKMRIIHEKMIRLCRNGGAGCCFLRSMPRNYGFLWNETARKRLRLLNFSARFDIIKRIISISLHAYCFPAMIGQEHTEYERTKKEKTEHPLDHR